MDFNDETFDNLKCQEASDLFGTGKSNCAFKMGAEWAAKYFSRIGKAVKKVKIDGQCYRCRFFCQNEEGDIFCQAMNKSMRTEEFPEDEDMPEFPNCEISEIILVNKPTT